MEYMYGFVAEHKLLSREEDDTLHEVKDFINSFVIHNHGITRILYTRTSLDVIGMPDTCNLVNLQKINDINWINKFLESVNAKLPVGGIFISCVEIYSQRKNRIKNKYPKLIAIAYLGFSFIYNRVLPRVNITRHFHSYLTKGNNRVMSKAEVLGRLISCGFEILDYTHINNLLYFAAKKVNKPCANPNPTFGLLIKMKRLGKGGKIINVYKLRTMHPYSEFLQEYIYNCNNVDKGGKFKDDFRIAHWGKIVRKLWIDELPMLFNFFKGDLKLVGIRPLSPHYFSLYPPEHKDRRLRYKPGLIPPYYADSPKTMEEISASEKKYLDQYDRHPFLTDVKYFFFIFYNIVFKGVRSR